MEKPKLIKGMTLSECFDISIIDSLNILPI